MPSKPYPPDVVRQAESVLNAWNEIGATVTVGTLTHAQFAADLDAAAALHAEMDQLQAQLIDKRNERDALYTAIWDKVKRIRNGVKGLYGDDSSQYEMVGGTRTSERKSPTRKTVTA